MTAPRSGAGRRRLLGVAVAGGAAAVGAGAAWWRLRPTAPSDQAVSLLFTQSLPDAQGPPLALSGFAGKPLILNFWATWCPPCVEHMPELSHPAAYPVVVGGMVLVAVWMFRAFKRSGWL